MKEQFGEEKLLYLSTDESITMGREEAKIEILELLPQITENQLIGLVEYLRELANLSNLDKEVSNHLGKIIFEDDDLLKKLAQ